MKRKVRSTSGVICVDLARVRGSEHGHKVVEIGPVFVDVESDIAEHLRKTAAGAVEFADVAAAPAPRIKRDE
jgi:hypothetical protein